MPLIRNKIIKTSAKAALGLSLLSIGFYFFWIFPRYSVPILTYHSFAHKEGLLSVPPESFERQMRYLKDKGFNVIPLGELVTGLKNKRRFTHNTVVITIDDGYEDNFTYAYPVLKKYGFPATVFLITNRIGTDADYLSWGEVKEMSKHNISFGGHTKSHVYLPSVINKDVLWDEIAGCKNVIEEHIGAPVDYFGYPLGGFTKEVELLVKKAGYKGACVTSGGDGKFNKYNVYEFNRISIRNNKPYFAFSNLFAQIIFEVKLSGYYNLLRKKRVNE